MQLCSVHIIELMQENPFELFNQLHILNIEI